MSRLDLIDNWIDLARKADYNATRLARVCEVSSSQLRRYFLTVFYRPPQEWINELRLWDAMQMFARGHSAKSVACILRFSNSAHLSRRYKEYHGAPPTVHIRLRVAPDRSSSLIPEFLEPRQPWVYAERCLLSPLHRKMAPAS